MERLLPMDKEQFIADMQAEVRRILGQVADAVNNAPDGNVISGSEVAVRETMVDLQRRAFEKAVPMRLDSTESSFSPSQGRPGQAQAEPGPVGAKHPEPQRADRGAAESTVSVGVRELSCRLGIAGGSFGRSVENLKHAASITRAHETLRQVVESEGHAVLAASQTEPLEIDWSAAECKTTTPSGQEVSRIDVSADGVMVPVTTAAEKQKRRATVLKQRRERPRQRGKGRAHLPAVKAGADQRYKPFYLTAFYDQDQKHRRVSVTRKNHKVLGKLLRRDAARLRLRAADERVGLVDGAVCLRKQMDGLPLEAVGLDFYHFAEHVHESKRGTFAEAAESGEAGKAWAGDLLHRVKHEGDGRSRQRSRSRRACADGLLHDVAQRREMIAYDEFEKRGWHIGSGPIEAMCKAMTRRLKGPGMRWDSDPAEGIMALEALHQSNLWDRYWTNALWQRN